MMNDLVNKQKCGEYVGDWYKQPQLVQLDSGVGEVA